MTEFCKEDYEEPIFIGLTEGPSFCLAGDEDLLMPASVYFLKLIKSG